MHDFLPWLGLGILLVLCLPILPIQRVVLVVSSWALRLALIGLLVSGAYLWFRPGEFPESVSRILADFSGLFALLPERGSQAFALCLACWVAAALIPILAALDVARSGIELRKSVKVVETHEAVLPVGEPVEEMGVPILRPVERTKAAAVLAGASSRRM